MQWRNAEQTQTKCGTDAEGLGVIPAQAGIQYLKTQSRLKNNYALTSNKSFATTNKTAKSLSLVCATGSPPPAGGCAGMTEERTPRSREVIRKWKCPCGARGMTKRKVKIF